jgi:universal bacterial protein YeaZ
MACILHLETSTDTCSVALSEDGALLFAKEEAPGSPSHEVAFSGLVDEALSMADSAAKRLDAVALSCGPGSYTGLRISASMAKGICYGRDLPLIALPTLEVTCVPVLLRDDLPEEALLCPMIDARRMEVYAAVYDRALTPVRDVAADVVEAGTYNSFLDRGPVWFFGGGAEKCKSVITHPNARFVEGVRPLARWMFPLAEKAFNAGRFEDVAYFEPFYLKEFVASKPRDLLRIEN